MSNNCKNWVFQIEECPTTKRLHFQGRVSLKTKMRCDTLAGKARLCDINAHWSPTSTNAVTNAEFDYVMKEDTRVEGPWKDRETEIKHEIPDKLDTVIKMEREGLKPWQQTIVDMCNIYDDRTIDIIFDRKGGIGKSSLLKYLDDKDRKLAYQVPTIANIKDLMQAVMSIIKGKGLRKSFVVDFPRGVSHKAQNALWCGLEDLKNGFVYDTRYKYDYIRFNEPRVFVFTNTLPPVYLMSKDRWKYWYVCNDELKTYLPGPEDYIDPVEEAAQADLRRQSVQKKLAKEVAVNDFQINQLQQVLLPLPGPPANEPNMFGSIVPTSLIGAEAGGIAIPVPVTTDLWASTRSTGLTIKLSNMIKSPVRFN